VLVGDRLLRLQIFRGIGVHGRDDRTDDALVRLQVAHRALDDDRGRLDVLRAIARDLGRFVTEHDIDRLGIAEREHDVDVRRLAVADGDLRDLDRLAGEHGPERVRAAVEPVDRVEPGLVRVRLSSVTDGGPVQLDLRHRDRLAGVGVACETEHRSLQLRAIRRALAALATTRDEKDYTHRDDSLHGRHHAWPRDARQAIIRECCARS
jgi:hypothetical protein